MINDILRNLFNNYYIFLLGSWENKLLPKDKKALADMAYGMNFENMLLVDIYTDENKTEVYVNGTDNNRDTGIYVTLELSYFEVSFISNLIFLENEYNTYAFYCREGI